MTIYSGGLLILLGFVSLGTQAQSIQPTVRFHSLSQALATAFQQNSTQLIYQQQLKQATFNHKAAKSFLLPAASLAFNATDNLRLPITPVPGSLLGHPETTYFVQFGKPYSYVTGLSLTQDILNWPAKLQAKIAEKSIQLNKAHQEAYRQYLTEQTAKLYYSALIAKAALQQLAIDKQLADSLATTVQQRQQEGTATGLLVNQALIQVNNIKQSQAQRKQLYEYSIENLKMILGQAPANSLQLTEDLNPDSLMLPAHRSLGEDKTQAIYQQQVGVAELQRQAQRSVAYPRLWLSAYLGLQQFRETPGFSISNTDWSAYRYINLTLGLPLFAGFAAKNKYESAVLQRTIAQLQSSQFQYQREINDRLLRQSYQDYVEMTQASAANFTLYTRNLQLNRQRYQEGITSLDLYLRSFVDYLVAENTYFTNLSQLVTLKSTWLARR